MPADACQFFYKCEICKQELRPKYCQAKVKIMDIYISNLPFKLKETQLRELFEQYGQVTSVKIIVDNITRQNKGFGFVAMPDEK
jgi:RNA recognition motif-containing protein